MLENQATNIPGAGQDKEKQKQVNLWWEKLSSAQVTFKVAKPVNSPCT